MGDYWVGLDAEQELRDVQTAMSNGELPHVEYCGLVEDAEGLPNPFRWLLILRGGGGDDDEVDSRLPPLDDAEGRLLGKRNALFFGVMLHLEVSFPSPYQAMWPQFSLVREWLHCQPVTTDAANLRQDVIVGESACRRALVRDAIGTGSRLFQLFFPQSETLSFTVTTMSGARLLLSTVRADWTVLYLLRTIAEKEGSYSSYTHENLEFHLYIVRQGVPLLHGKKTLREYGVKTGDVLHCCYDLGEAAGSGTLVGPRVSRWSGLWKSVHMLRCLPIMLLRVRPFHRLVPHYMHPIVQAGGCEGEVHWRLRAAWPQHDVVWSPERFAEWPLYFRRCVRYLRKVAVRDGTGTVRPLPYDIVNEIATYL